jgi:hypothetical protein
MLRKHVHAKKAVQMSVLNGDRSHLNNFARLLKRVISSEGLDPLSTGAVGLDAPEKVAILDADCVARGDRETLGITGNSEMANSSKRAQFRAWADRYELQNCRNNTNAVAQTL